mgnify:FL=1
MVSRHQVYLERVKTGLTNNYQDDIRKIDEAVRKLLAGLEVETLGQLSKKQLTALLRDLRDLQLPMYAKAMDGIVEQLAELSVVEAGFEAKLIGGALRAKAVAAAKPYTAALARPIAATGDLLEPFLTDLSTRQVRRIEKEIQKSIGMGRTISQTVQAVRGTKARKYQDGVLQRNWNDARIVIRTATQHVSQASRDATWAENGIEKYQIVATLDSKTSDTCKGLDGKVFEVGKGPTPPFHPGCRTTTVPWFPPSVWDEGATRSAAGGPVSADETYYTWLKDQPVNFQNDALGPVRAKLFREGGLSAQEFAELSLDRNFQPLTITEMKRLNPHAFEKANL